MESRLKERLTGAAILVALIVLIVPEIFHDRRGVPSPVGVIPAGPPAVRPGASAAPTRSYTIELAAQPPPAAAQPPPASAQPPASPQPPATQGRSAPASAQPDAKTPRAAERQPAARGKGGIHPARPAQSAGRAAAEPVARARAAAAPPVSAPDFAAPAKARVATASPTHPRSGAWTVQLGLFAKAANAERLAHTAQSHGFTVQISRFGSRELYRVAVAGIADRASAEQLSHRLRGAGLPAAILGPR